ncbi:MAG: long-chain fatty acid--CoA ligase [Alphaproteobacteria bacterium]|nr:long-chain fatty acid--CoA ligase [Alphaproteobacteria bacterium]
MSDQQPWLKHYPPGVRWDHPFEALPLFEAFERSASTWPDNTHLDFFGRKLSYLETAELVSRAAKGLQALGVKKGIKVGLFLPNCPQQVISFFAVLKAGGTVVNYSPLYSEDELLYQIEDSQTDLMITLDLEALYPKAAELLKESRLTTLIVDSFAASLPWPKSWAYALLRRGEIAKVAAGSDHVAFDALLDDVTPPEPVAVDPYEDVAVLQYTGGTTGQPKGAMLTHANLHINAQQIGAWAPQFEPGKERLLGALPFFHAFAMTGQMIFGSITGSEIILHPRFDLDAVMKDFRTKQPTAFSGVPTMFTAMLRHKDATRQTFESLRWCISGGAPMPRAVLEGFKEKTGVEPIEGYGLTETSPAATSGIHHGRNKPGSIGLPMPGTKIHFTELEDPHKILPVGETGEICVEGPQVMKGYWNRPEATAKALVEGRLRTGDIGYMDEEGYTFIIDRAKDMILVGGFNVFPRVVEEAIHKHPAVHEVSVIGVPDDYLGEAPKAFIVLKDPDEDLPKEHLMTFLREHLGKHELPREIEYRSELPKTLIGKLSKKELREEEAERSSGETPAS